MREIALDVGIDITPDCPKCGHTHKPRGMKKSGSLFVPKYSTIDFAFSAPMTQWTPAAAPIMGKSYIASALTPFMPVYGKSPFAALTGITEPELPELPKLPTRKATKPFIGYRAWYLGEDEEDLFLTSTVRSDVWPGPVFRADGKPSPCDPFHHYKDQDFDKQIHGIYAYKEAEHAVGYDVEASGQVALSGTVVVHEHGYRAEVATIQRIVLDADVLYKYDNAKEKLAERYQCPVSYNVEDLDSEHR